APRQLHEIGNEGIARVARQQRDRGLAKRSPRNQVFSPQPVPGIAFRPILEAVMRINNPRNSVLAAVSKIERELLPFLVGKISVEKRADPRPAAFGNGNDNGVGAGKLAGAAAEIPSHHATNLFAYVWRSSGAAPDKSPRYFIGSMMSESASSLQQGLTIIEIRPPGTVGSVLRPQGVQPYWTGANA